MTEFKKTCSNCRKILDSSFFHKCRSKKDGLQTKCKDCAYKISKKWREENRERSNSVSREWSSRNPEKSYQKARRWHEKNPGWQAEYKRNKRKNDPVFAMMDRVRCRIWQIVKHKHNSKSEETKKIIGCDWDHLCAHIENKFKDGMSWGNRQDWHIDHIIPLASAETINDVLRLCHYTNLQPLWAYENKSKGSSVSDKE